jgi:hypothetical protein
MADVLVDDLLVRLLADTRSEERLDAIAFLRVVALALRSPLAMADALDRAAARLEGTPHG